MNIGFIGAGKVGFSLGKYFTENEIDVTGYYSRNPESAKSAAEFTNSIHYSSVSELVRSSEIIFITAPDSAINQIYNEIKTLGISEKQVCHCSGSMTAAEAFPDISEYGASGYSIHPLYPVSDKYTSYIGLKDAFFCIEGNNLHLNEWKSFFGKLGNETRIISGKTKSEYHAACVIISNLVCALAAESISLMKDCGFAETEALAALRPLAESNMRNIFEKGPVTALTGPIERCDIPTVLKHLKCISSEHDREMYRSVSLRLTELAEEKNPDKDYDDMKKLLS